MIRIKDLKEHFTVQKAASNSYYLFSKEIDRTARFVNRYFCCVTVLNRGRFVIEQSNNPISKIETLVTKVREHVDSLEFDSDYYYPMLRRGVAEEMFVSDYMSKLGFLNLRENYWINKDFNLSISFWELSSFEEVNEEVKINHWHSPGSWTQYVAKRNFNAIKTAIDELVLKQTTAYRDSINTVYDDIVQKIKGDSADG